MQEPNKIDQNYENHNKKSLKLPKLSNPFKKQDAIKRDEEGKFATTSGSGGLSVVKKIYWKRAAPLVVILVILGGGLVLKSFAGGSQQMVTSWYRTCLNKEPDSGGLAYWSGRVDKGENGWTVLTAFMNAGHVSSCGYPDTAKNVQTIQTPTLQTKPAAPGSTQVGSTGTDKLIADSNAWVVLSAAHVANAKKENAATFQISTKSVISKTDLSTISSKIGYVRGAISQLQPGVGKVSSMYNQSVSGPATKTQGPAVMANLKSLQSNIASLNNYLVNISNDNKRAETTYEANLSFFDKVGERDRNEKDCKNKGGSFNPWSGLTGSCSLPQPTPSSEGGGSGNSGGSGGGQEKPPAPDKPETKAEKIARWQKWCDSRPPQKVVIKVTGGLRTEWRDVYYDGSGLERCNTKHTGFSGNPSCTTSEGWVRSGTICVKQKNASVNYSKLPWPMCGDGAKDRCVKTVIAYNGKSRGGFDNSISYSSNYISKVEVCKLKIVRFGFGLKRHIYSNCTTQSGKWSQ